MAKSSLRHGKTQRMVIKHTIAIALMQQQFKKKANSKMFTIRWF